MDEDEVLGKITKLLEQGCTMLATHHSCGAPLFRCKGEVVCPVCSFPDQGAAVDLGPEAGAEAEPSAGKREGPISETAPSDVGRLPIAERPGIETLAAGSDQQAAVEEEIRSAILDKLRELSGDLRREHDLSRLDGQLCCIDSAIRVLRSLSRQKP